VRPSQRRNRFLVLALTLPRADRMERLGYFSMVILVPLHSAYRKRR